MKALLHDLDVLAGDYERKVSRGYVGGDRQATGSEPDSEMKPQRW